MKYVELPFVEGVRSAYSMQDYFHPNSRVSRSKIHSEYGF